MQPTPQHSNHKPFYKEKRLITITIYSEENPIGKIYLTTNIVNGMQYVGQTIQLNNKSYKGSGNLLKEAFEEFGKENFIVEDLEYVYCRSELDRREIYWINKKNTLKPNGYNITNGGSGAYVPTEKVKKKISKSLKGRIFSKETLKKKSEIQKGEKNSFYGKKHSKETILLIKEKLKNKHPWLGRKHSEESKRKISKTAKGRKPSLKTRIKMKQSAKIRKFKKTGPQKIITCPYCNQSGGYNNIVRYHFNNCKQKENMHVIEAKNPADGWIRVVNYLLENGEKRGGLIELLNVGIEINSPDIDENFDKRFREVFGDDRIDYAASVTFVEPKQGKNLFGEELIYQQNDPSAKWNRSYWGRLISWNGEFNQVEQTIKRLKKNQESKTIVMSVYNPKTDGKLTMGLPCMLTIDCKPRNGKLHVTANLRSNAVSKSGYADYWAIAQMTKFLAEQSGCLEFGTATVFAHSSHLRSENNELKNTKKLLGML